MSPQSIDEIHQDVTKISSPVVTGLVLLALFIGGFGIWAATAPLSGAVIAAGWIAKQGDTQSVAHEKGGVVSNISISEGQTVAAGDLLITISDADRQALYGELMSRIAALQIREQRLKAEENGAERFEMPDQLPIAFNSDDKTATSTIWDHDLKAMLRDQKQEFQSRKQRVKQDKLILSQQKTALDQQLEGVKAELASVFAQMAILKEQRISRKALIRQGYGRKVDLQETERDLAQLRGQQAQLQARQNSLPHQIAELQARLQNVESLFQEDISKEMADLRVEKLTLQKQFEAAQTAMSRVEVRAPTSGTVNKIHVNTIGSAVGAFQPLVEIVPDSKQILVEVEVQPMDIEQVRIGQKATLVLSAYEADKVAPVSGKVQFVSPDRRINERTQQPYFVARLQLDEQAENLPDLTPGMPVEAYMETSRRTFAQILIEPITKSLRRAFRG